MGMTLKIWGDRVPSELWTLAAVFGRWDGGKAAGTILGARHAGLEKARARACVKGVGTYPELAELR